jgi:hypothetical protein
MPDDEARLSTVPSRTPWNKGKPIGAKPPTATKACLVDQNPIDGWALFPCGGPNWRRRPGA